MRSRRSLERKVEGLVDAARLAVPDYGRRVVRDRDIQKVAQVYNLSVHRVDELAAPALLYPPIAGCYRLAVDSAEPFEVRRYVTLHEVGHIVRGEAEEAMRLLFFGSLPETEDVCDLFALLGVIDPIHDGEGCDWLELKIREAVPLDDYGWQKYRIPRLAKRLAAVRKSVLDRLDGDFFGG